MNAGAEEIVDDGGVPYVASVTTDRREGEEGIGPYRTACPACEAEGHVTKEINRCGRCTTWFRVILP